MLVLNEKYGIEELERYGFKPVYDTETGELREYFYVEQKYGEANKLFFKKEEQTRGRKLRIRFSFLRDEKTGFFKREEKRKWIVDNFRHTFDSIDFDMLYFLIKKEIIIQEK